MRCNSTSYTLLITEKPSSAKRIAEALNDKGIPIKHEEQSVTYYDIEKDGQKIRIVPAIGHLYSVTQEGKGWTYPVFQTKWVPAYMINKISKNTKNFIQIISKLAKEAKNFISATDFDIEGSQIAYSVLKYACGESSLNKAQRMKFSTLTKQDLSEAFNSLSPTLDWGLIEAGRTRHEIDWIYGINLSRAMILSLKKASGMYKALSTGRVQGPTLAFIAEREKKIRSFVPKPYWDINAVALINGEKYPLEYSKRKIWIKKEAEKTLNECYNKRGIISQIQTQKSVHRPPTPFDLGTLQSEAYSNFRFTPSRTLRIAEGLYLNALISYPRTSSQKFPPSIDTRAIMKSLSSIKQYSEMIRELLSKEKLVPIQGRKEDPAHPPIHPTGNLPEKKLNDSERKIFDLVIRRFLAIFGDPAIRESLKVEVNINGHLFYLRGRRILKPGWQKYYSPYVKSEELILPQLNEGQEIKLDLIEIVDKYTSPPPRFNPKSVLSLMENQHIGTKATRAEIIDTLYSRGYVTGERISMTPLGFSVISLLSKYCSEVLSVELTRELEQEMEDIEIEKSTRQEVIIDAVEKLTPILKDFKLKEQAVGEGLSEAIISLRKEQSIIGICPVCENGRLTITYSRKTRKRFVGCSNYWTKTCNFSVPIPQRGDIEATGKKCPHCDFPTIRIRRIGKKPWNMCINWQNCPGRKQEAQQGEDSQ
ncbi:MAG: DNA topoisomerase I [Candidatus Jordarchaeum sp.]|uniref:DNA topoisomerase I n=1 Tax=Candidatus Jordarchaeum sp. TaxID=2823881 RepID=UPI00404B7387